MPDRLKYLENPNQSSISGAGNFDAGRYNKTLKLLETFKFWEGQDNVLSLWEHQRSAIAHVTAYLNSDHSLNELREGEGGGTEAALLKLPTGTGKSGIVAVVTRCIPEVKRALVLTPRTAITKQLMRDIQYRFWQHMGFNVNVGSTWAASANVAGFEIADSAVEALLPNLGQLEKLLSLSEIDRFVIVGTLQAFDDVRRSRDSLERKERTETGLDEPESLYLETTRRFFELLRSFDIVIVDEGHYEPAPSWSRSVRNLDVPTVLLSATPFRNDYKLFRVRGRYVFNIPYQTACEQNIVRQVKFITDLTLARTDPLDQRRLALLREEVGFEDSKKVIDVTQHDRDEANRFATLLASQFSAVLKDSESITDSPKIIIRGASFESLVLIQKALRERIGEHGVLVHERVKKSDAVMRHYKDVSNALRAFPEAKLWLHETKLLEGIDDPNIIAVALYDSFTNERQLVQQIGRAIRSTDKARVEAQTAYVIASPNLIGNVQKSWERYLEFENHCAKGLENVVPSEANLPEKIVEHIPEMQYVNGQFRHRLPSDLVVSSKNIVLPLRASVFVPNDDFDLDTAKLEALEAILASDRFVVREIEALPENAFGWTFFGVRESPYLTDHFMTEWVVGVFIAVRIGALFFVQDTDGIVFNPEKLDITRLERRRLLKLFLNETVEDSAITRMSALSLDMSDRAIRSIATRTRSFAETFTDLLDPVLVPTAVSGFVGSVGRYVGVRRARISESTDEYENLNRYLNWLSQIESELADKTNEPSHVFDRYAQPAEVNSNDASAPTNILLDLTHDTLSEYGVIGELDGQGSESGELAYQDFCLEIDEEGKFFLCALDGEKVPCSIEYVPKSRRYRLVSAALNDRHPPRTRLRQGRATTLTERINRDQAFRLTIPKDGIVYMQGEFHQSGDFVGADGTVLPLEDTYEIPLLFNTVSEKGEKFFDDRERWATQSIFGAVKRACDGGETADFGKLWRYLESHPLILLDDGGQEIADFIAIGDRQLTLIHAKASKDVHHESVTELQAVGRQASASLAFCSSRARVNDISDDRFERKYIANEKKLNISRIFRNSENIPRDKIAHHVRSAMMNPSYRREIWIVAGRLIDPKRIRKRAIAADLSNRQRQLLMFIESLRTSCGRANAQLRIFGHEGHGK